MVEQHFLNIWYLFRVFLNKKLQISNQVLLMFYSYNAIESLLFYYEKKEKLSDTNTTTVNRLNPFMKCFVYIYAMNI